MRLYRFQIGANFSGEMTGCSPRGVALKATEIYLNTRRSCPTFAFRGFPTVEVECEGEGEGEAESWFLGLMIADVSCRIATGN